MSYTDMTSALTSPGQLCLKRRHMMTMIVGEYRWGQEVAAMCGYTVYASGKGGSRKMRINEMGSTQGGFMRAQRTPPAFSDRIFQASCGRPLIRLINCSCVMVTMVASAVSLAGLNGVTTAQPQRAADAIQRGWPILFYRPGNL